MLRGYARGVRGIVQGGAGGSTKAGAGLAPGSVLGPVLGVVLEAVSGSSALLAPSCCLSDNHLYSTQVVPLIIKMIPAIDPASSSLAPAHSAPQGPEPTPGATPSPTTTPTPPQTSHMDMT